MNTEIYELDVKAHGDDDWACVCIYGDKTQKHTILGIYNADGLLISSLGDTPPDVKKQMQRAVRKVVSV